MSKTRLRALADGGSPGRRHIGAGMADKAADALSNRGRRIDALIDEAEGIPPAAQQPPAPAVQPAPEQPSRNSRFRSVLRSMFGMADGGRVKGPGGRTEDKVGPVMLSDDEYVLPADTADAIGRDKLDALRLATHTFEDGSREKQLVARLGKSEKKDFVGLADGGSPWEVDRMGNVRKPGSTMKLPPPPEAPKLPPPASQSRALGVPSEPVYKRPPIDITPEGTRSVPKAATVDISNARIKTPLTRTGELAKSALRVVAPVAGIAGAAQSLDDSSSGYRDQFQKDLGVQSPAGSIAADAVRTLANVGDAATFGLAGRVGRGISGAVGGEGFVSGFMSPSDRDKFEKQRLNRVMGDTGAATARSAQMAGGRLFDPKRSDQGAVFSAEPGSYQSKRLSEMGVPLSAQNANPVVDSAHNRTDEYLKRGGTDQFQNLGTYGGNANIYGRASDPARPGRINEFVGVGGDKPSGGEDDPIRREMLSALRRLDNKGSGDGVDYRYVDRTASINRRFDKLANELSEMYGPKGRGNLARRLLELEGARANALDANDRNLTSRENSLIQNSALRDNATLNARTSLMNSLAQMDRAHSANAAKNGQDVSLKTLMDAQKMAQEQEEKGYERYTKAIGQMFTKLDKEGNEVVDKGTQERFRSFIEASDPQAREKFAAMSPQQQQYTLQNFKTLFEMNDQRNRTAKSGSMMSSTGGVTNRMDMPVDVREATWNDYWNNNLPLLDYVWSNLPGTDRNVVVTESGQPVLYSNYTSTRGARDLDKEKLVRDSIAARRSALRGN